MEFNKILKIWKLILCFMSDETQYMVIITRFHKFYWSSPERRREDRAPSCETGAAFLVTFCCDQQGNTKCQKQIKRFAISQLIHYLNIYTVIKPISTFTRAALCGTLTGGEADS